MIIVGAKGFAKEVFQILFELNQTQGLAFFDDISEDLPEYLYDSYPILTNENDVKSHFENFGSEFILGLGNPKLRKRMSDKFEALGGKLVSTISPKSEIGSFDLMIGEGSNILPLSVIANGSKVGKACIVYYNTLITHDCNVGDFVELSPGATLLGGCEIGDFAHIGANATILPGIKIGKGAIVGAGAVVNKNVVDNSTVSGVPAKEHQKNK